MFKNLKLDKVDMELIFMKVNMFLLKLEKMGKDIVGVYKIKLLFIVIFESIL